MYHILGTLSKLYVHEYIFFPVGVAISLVGYSALPSPVVGYVHWSCIHVCSYIHVHVGALLLCKLCTQGTYIVLLRICGYHNFVRE